MAVKSTPALLKAIEGYRGETSGSKEHEPINALLARVVDEVHKGSGTPQDSPGRREAKTAAGQRDMGAETGHDGGDGQVKSNRPGDADQAEAAPDIAGSNGSNDDRNWSAGPVRSGGQTDSALPNKGLAPGTAEIRRIAADREKNRPDTKYSHTEGKGDDNKQSNPPGPTEMAEKRVGNVSAPAPNEGGMQREAQTAASQSERQPEPEPPYAKEGLQGDGWEEARNRARKVLAKAK